MANVRIADLPTITQVDGQSYLIIEKPEYGQGTYKATVEDLQKVIAVDAQVNYDQATNSVIITIQDMNGTTTQRIVIPTARVVDNHDNTATIYLSDKDGQTSATVVTSVAIDAQPTAGSSNMVTSGTLYSIINDLTQRIAFLESHAIIDSQ